MFNGKYRSSSSSGLTLIEILVAMAILSVILISVYGTFFNVQLAVDSTDNVMYRYRAIRIFFDLMEREVQSAYVDMLSDGNSTFFTVKDRDTYGKKMSELSFTAFAPYGPGLFALQYEMDPEKKILYKQAISFMKSEEAPRMEVLGNVEEFQVEVNSKGRWIGTYDGSRTRDLPDEVRVTLKLDLDGEIYSFEETIEPKLR